MDQTRIRLSGSNQRGCAWILNASIKRVANLRGRGAAAFSCVADLCGLLILGALLIAEPRAGFAQASVEGRVELPKNHSAPVVSQRYEIVSKGGVVSTNPPLGVVYLEGHFETTGPLPMKQVLQKGLSFVPALLPVQAGTRVEFPNLDDTYHNIFSFSPAKRFDLGRYRPEERPIPSQLFERAGLITLRCDIHEHMRGLILVVETPHFVMTDAEGHFHLSGLPPGHYLLKAWINSQTTLERPVELKNGATVHVDFP